MNADANCVLLTATFELVLTLAPALPFAEPLSGLMLPGSRAASSTLKCDAALDVTFAILPIPSTVLFGFMTTALTVPTVWRGK